MDPLIDITRYCQTFTGDLWASGAQSPPMQLPLFREKQRSPIQWSPAAAVAAVASSSSPSVFPVTDFSSWSLNGSTTCKCCLRATALPWPETPNHCGDDDDAATANTTTDNSSSLFRAGSACFNPAPIARPKQSPAKSKAVSERHETKKDKDDDDDYPLRLHVSNIPFSWPKEKLAAVFEEFGTTYDVEIVYNARGSKGFGFVTYLSFKSGLKAMSELNNQIVDGRRLVVNYAKPKQKKSVSSSYYLEELKISRNERAKLVQFSTPPTVRRQLVVSTVGGSSSLTSTPTRSRDQPRQEQATPPLPPRRQQRSSGASGVLPSMQTSRNYLRDQF